MTEDYPISSLARTSSGPPDEFQRLTGPYHHELLVHSYRFLGSLEDAEDALQETLLRAWRRWETLNLLNSLRAWLYKIATHVSLDMLGTRKTRSLPSVTYPPADPSKPLPDPVIDPVWIEPLPEEYLDRQSATPEARIEARESVSLAFLALLQKLPGRQRAVLLLMDVLGWKAQEAAAALEQTVASTNSALQRARATLKGYRTHSEFYRNLAAESSQMAQLLNRYIQAWEAADLTNLVSLLHEDVILTMPPLTVWFHGIEKARAFIERMLFTGDAAGRFRLVATRANGCPAFAVYQWSEQGSYRPAGLQVLRVEGGVIAQIDDFLVFDDRLFKRFKLPLKIDR